MSEFKLSASLSGHDDDVRGVSFPSPKAIISASRDGTVRIWNLLSDNPPSYDATISSHQAAFVNTVAYLPPNAQFQEGLIISGGKDVVIDVRQPSKKPEDNAEALLLGHSQNICALDVDPAGKFIVSGAWDSEARIWPVGQWECESVLRGHQGSVWAVLALDSETIITGAADQQIRVFQKSGKLLKAFKGSDSPVRALCRLQNHPSAADFASAANDGIIRLWTVTGKQVGELIGHESFIYSVASTPTGEIVSSGEDRTVRIWKGTECIQTITHPAISVWQVAVCAQTGDIASGASDRILRVFTRSPERAADVETTRQFEDSVKESSIPQQQLGDINKEQLPGPEFITQKSGTKEGQVQMIRELNGAVNAYQWSSGQQQWINVGTVVDAVGSNGKKTDYLGKEYDYVFDVDIEDGKPALKLPYNLSQNPYEAATKFIQDNELPITYLDQVANFITTNTQGATLGQPSQDASTHGSDSWGSENRYRPGGDASASTPPVAASPKVIPQKEYLNILVARAPAIEKKIIELNHSLLADGHKDISLNPTELSILANLRKNIELATSQKPQSVPGGLELAVKIATKWPYKDRLPGLDLLRLLAIAPETAKFTLRGGNIIDILVAGASEQEPPADNHVMMSVRGFVNLFNSAEGRALAVTEFGKIQNFINVAIKSSTNRNLLVAATTVYINYAVEFKSETSSTSFDQVASLMEYLSDILKSQSDSEVIYRALVATGSLMSLDAEVRAAAKDVFGIGPIVTAAVGRATDPRIKNISKEVQVLLR